MSAFEFLAEIHRPGENNPVAVIAKTTNLSEHAARRVVIDKYLGEGTQVKRLTLVKDDHRKKTSPDIR